MTNIEIQIPDRISENFIDQILDYLEDYAYKAEDSYKITVLEDKPPFVAWGYEKLPNTITTAFTET